MSVVRRNGRYAAYVALWVAVFLSVPLWLEFHEQGEPLWNVFLLLILVAAVFGAFLGVRYLQANGVEVGEARFKPSDRGHS